jgi:hypothetical protein
MMMGRRGQDLNRSEEYDSSRFARGGESQGCSTLSATENRGTGKRDGNFHAYVVHATRSRLRESQQQEEYQWQRCDDEGRLARSGAGEESLAQDERDERAQHQQTFITRVAKKIVEAGGSLRDVQELAGHALLSTTQRYIQGDSAAKRRVVNM